MKKSVIVVLCIILILLTACTRQEAPREYKQVTLLPQGSGNVSLSGKQTEFSDEGTLSVGGVVSVQNIRVEAVTIGKTSVVFNIGGTPTTLSLGIPVQMKGYDFTLGSINQQTATATFTARKMTTITVCECRRTDYGRQQSCQKPQPGSPISSLEQKVVSHCVTQCGKACIQVKGSAGEYTTTFQSLTGFLPDASSEQCSASVVLSMVCN